MAGFVVYLVGSTDGEPTSLDESWLVEYGAARRPGPDPEQRGRAHIILDARIVTTPDPRQAQVFPTHGAAHSYCATLAALYHLVTSPVSIGVDAG